MSMRPPVIAHRTLICRPAGEAEREVVVRIRAPVPEAGRWLCEAELEHLYRDVARVMAARLAARSGGARIPTISVTDD
jgi:hypothetical protein